jgi:KaiC/GvpD/RAD55 family RecA-like ATPase
MTLRESLVAAIRVSKEHPSKWLTYAAQHESVKPTPEESTLLESIGHPIGHWGALCFLADELRRNAAVEFLDTEAEAQIQGAEGFLDLEAKDFLHWPWKSLDDAIGGMAPGTLHYVVCPSKGGKTTLCRSAVAEWCKGGKKILYGGFEMKAETLRTMFAADDCGMDPGDVLTGAWHGFDHYEALRARMKDAYSQQRREDHWYRNLRFTGFERVGQNEVRSMMEIAREWGADAVIIDHADHVEATGSLYEASVKTNALLLELTKSTGTRTIVTSQTNGAGKGQDSWRDHKPVREEVVKFGSHKKEIATTMMGFYRPLRPGMRKEEREQVEFGERPMSDFLLTGANAFNIIGHRAYGSRNGMRGYVGWERGRIVEPSEGLLREIEAARNNIRTKRGE